MSFLVRSTPRRGSTLPLSTCARYWALQGTRNPNGNSCRPYSSNVKTGDGADTLSRGLRGFALGVALTALGFYAFQTNSLKLDGQNISAVRPENSPKAVTAKNSALLDPTQAGHFASKEDIQKAIAELREALPGQHTIITDPVVLESYGHSDNSYHPTSPHSVVVHPHSTEDVVKIVNIARKYKVPLVPYSGATSLEGHFSGYPSGDICVDMSGMNKILEIHEADGDLICQSGARWEDINYALKEKGIPLFFPLDPGPGATIGGMIGTGCSGTNAVRYGTARGEWFLNVTVVLPNGKVVKTRRRARKSSTGFDTTKLFIGAEGTLGIVTEATLRLAPVIPSKVAMSQFPDVEHAVSAVQEILNTSHGPHIQCVELLDDNMMNAVNNAGIVSEAYPVRDTLFFKIQGEAADVQSTAHAVESIISRHGGTGFKFAETDEEGEVLWESRKYALMSTIASVEGARCWTTDVCVPVSKLPELVYETKKDLAENNLMSTIVGHVGDGNFHALILFKTDNELQHVSEAVHRLVHRAIALDGTCTGEHGVGLGKKEYLVDELGENTIELMRTVKKAIDPDNIMNPSKLYPDAVDEPKKQKH